MWTLTLVTRAGCHLCEEAEAMLAGLRADHEFGLELRDVDADPALAAAYTDHVPVLLIEGKLLSYWFVDREKVVSALASGPDGITVPPL